MGTFLRHSVDWCSVLLCCIDTSPQTVVYRGCTYELMEDGCQAANVTELQDDIYDVGIILNGTLCSCNRDFCNCATPTICTTLIFPANCFITVLAIVKALVA